MLFDFYGDSIVFGYGASDSSKNFVSLVGKYYNAKVNNYGIGGTKFTRTKEVSLMGHVNDMDFNIRYPLIDKSADYFFVMGGTNDWSHGKPFGENNSKNFYEFKGAINNFFDNLLKDFKKEQIYIITPIKRFNGSNKNNAGYNLDDYVNAIKNISKNRDLKCIDVYNVFDEPNVETSSQFFVDGIHPNDKGYELLANAIIKQIQRFENK